MTRPIFVFSRACCTLFLLAALLALPAPAEAATFSVNAADDVDDGACDARHCSLREAILAANRNPGEDTIAFSLPGDPPHFIVLTDVLPDLTDYGTVIDGETQPGYAGAPIIRIQAQRIELPYAFQVRGDYVTIRGLSLGGFGVAGGPTDGAIVVVSGIRALIQHNYLGLNVDGSPVPNARGVSVLPGATNVDIDGNVISANIGQGITSAGRNTYIHGNLIGTNPEGTASAGEQGIGILIGGSAQGNSVGSLTRGARNLISGNGTGVYIGRGEDHAVIGNFIGTDLSGREAVPNSTGVALDEIPLGAAVQGNVISGNREVGLEVRSSNSQIFSNWIGLTATGTAPLSNGFGVIVYGDGNIFGAIPPVGEGNVISGNTTEGIRIYSSWNILQGNFIGTDISGEVAVPNGTGVHIDGGDRTYLDGATAGGPNVISGNNQVGVLISNGGDFTSVWANLVGVGVSGGAIPNATGIQIENSQYSDIGRREYDGNTIRSNGIGLALYNGAANTTIAFNEIAGNTDHGLILSGGGAIERNTFSENSFFDNGGPGIEFLEPGVNGGIEPPELESFTRPSGSHGGGVTGTTCPNCRYEIFLVDPDPSGYGEGKEFYGGGEADAAGNFTYPIPPGIPFDSCAVVTVTTTGPDGNTSEFSANLGPTYCLDIPPIGLALGIPGLLILGALGGYLGGRSAGRPWLLAAGGGIAGGVIGVVLLVVIPRLPGVRVTLPQTPPVTEPAAQPLPPCSQFMGVLAPDDGATFELGTDVLFELSPQPDPPGIQTRWTFLLTGPSGDPGQKTSNVPRASLTEAGLDPNVPGFYSWSLVAERLRPQSNEWAPFCTGQPHRIFSIEAAGTTQVPPSATGTTLQDANCRRGPSTQYGILTHVTGGTILPIQGRNAEGTWWAVLPPELSLPCWLSGDLLESTADIGTLPVVIPPPLPTPTPTDEPVSPAQGCMWWNGNVFICRVPCPPNYQGAPCTP